MLLLAASLVSCEKESDDPAPDKTPIKFGKVETRAPVYSENDMKGEGGGFGVFASMNGAAGTSAAAEYSLFMENENIVQLKNISVAFDGEQILDGLNLDIKNKEFINYF